MNLDDQIELIIEDIREPTEQESVYSVKNIEYFNQAIETHGTDRFDYSESRKMFKNRTTEIPFYCRRHNHRFLITPRYHLRWESGGCQPCTSEKTRITKTEKAKKDFFKKAPIIHNNKYNYAKFIYDDANKHGIITCPIDDHGDFPQAPCKHLAGQGCPKCSQKRATEKCRKPFEKFLEQAYARYGENRYKYSEYLKDPDTVFVECLKCGNSIKQNVTAHLSGHGCMPCGIEKRAKEMVDKKRQKFFEIVKNDKETDFTNFCYTLARTKSDVVCKYCNNTYKVSPNNYYKGTRCPNCKNKTELILWEFLKDSFQVNRRCRHAWCKNEKTGMMFEFDFELLDSIIIECDGIQHFQNVMFFKKKNLKSNRERDLFKQKCALENNYSVIRISQEDVYYNRFDWKTSLVECIKNIQKNNLITVNYLSSNNIYNNFENIVSGSDDENDSESS